MLQAAKEFETELKKEPASVTEAPVETPATLSEEKEKDVEVSSKKESLWGCRTIIYSIYLAMVLVLFLRGLYNIIIEF